MVVCAIWKTASSSLVRRSLVERDRLLRNAPHYVAPLPTTVPIFDVFSGLANGIVRFLGLTRRPSRRGAIAIKTGLGIYDFFTRRRADAKTPVPWPQADAGQVAGAQPGDPQFRHLLRRLGQPAGAARHRDCCVMVFPRPGECQGAQLCDGRAVADEFLLLHDRVSDETLAIQPRLVINATGGWIDI
jgi:glycerol-3-phosphate dehydrogenase